jgi:hypothetical protein
MNQRYASPAEGGPAYRSSRSQPRRTKPRYRGCGCAPPANSDRARIGPILASVVHPMSWLTIVSTWSLAARDRLSWVWVWHADEYGQTFPLRGFMLRSEATPDQRYHPAGQ